MRIQQYFGKMLGANQRLVAGFCSIMPSMSSKTTTPRASGAETQ
jgi:hypothetical protein